MQPNILNRQSLPVILQSESSECGLACLAMIANYHGAAWGLRTLRAQHPISRRGVTLAELCRLAERLGLGSRAVRLELVELKKLVTPCILHWDMNHFVVLKRVRGNHLTVHDPAQGERRLTLAAASTHFTGVAAEFDKAVNFVQPETQPRVRIGDLWTQLRGFVPAIVQLLLLSLLLQCFALGAPFANQLVVDEALGQGDTDLLHVLVFGLALMLGVEVATGHLRSLVALYITQTLGFQMQRNLARHLLQLPVDFFARRHAGDIASRFASLDPVRAFLTTGLVTVVLDGLLAATTLVLMWRYSSTLALISIGGILLYLAVRLVSHAPQRRMAEEEVVARARVDTLFLENLRAMQPTKLFGREAQRLDVWQSALVEATNSGVRLQRFGLNLGTASECLMGVGNLAVLYVAANMVIDGNFTLGMLFAFQSYRSQFSSRAVSLVDAYLGWRMLQIHLERLGDLVYAPTEPPGRRPAPRLRGAIQVRNLTFQYAPSEPRLFDDLSFDVQAGEMVVISGASGSGKSTLLRLLLGLMEPVHGDIRYDGAPLHQFDRSSLRRQVGVVMQDDQLLAGSIRDNIAFFDPSAGQEQIESAARLAGVHHDITGLPMGYETLVGDLGSALSGGQVQRIFLARALFPRPRLLFMDEGTANLDSQREAEVVRLICGFDMTRVIIAHGSTFARVADRNLRLEAGRLLD